MALSKNKVYKKIGESGDTVSHPVQASTTIYQGAIVCFDSSGYITTAAATSGYRPAGIAAEYCDNSSGSAGDKEVKVEKGFGVYYATASAVQSHVGVPVYATADDTFTVSSGNSGCFGVIDKVVSGTAWYIRINRVLK